MRLLHGRAAQGHHHLAGFHDATVLVAQLAGSGEGGELHPTGVKSGQLFTHTDNGDLVAVHVLEDTLLGLVVVLHPAIAVHVVGCKVQPNGHLGFERDDGFHLEGRDLQYGKLRLLRHQAQLGERVTVVAAGLGFLAGMQQNVLDEGRGGRLAVRACDGDDTTGVVGVGQLRLADDGCTGAAEGLGPRDIGLNTRGDDDQVRPEGLRILRPGSGAEG